MSHSSVQYASSFLSRIVLFLFLNFHHRHRHHLYAHTHKHALSNFIDFSTFTVYSVVYIIYIYNKKQTCCIIEEASNGFSNAPKFQSLADCIAQVYPKRARGCSFPNRRTCEESGEESEAELVIEFYRLYKTRPFYCEFSSIIFNSLQAPSPSDVTASSEAAVLGEPLESCTEEVRGCPLLLSALRDTFGVQNVIPGV